MNEDIKSEITRVVKESDDLVTALECVGAMYGIPAANIVASNECDHIKVVDDHIICPRKKNPSENIKSIMCAIGAVMDFISQRINDKMDKYHADKIRHGKIVESIEQNADPRKGKVIARFEDEDGGEILAYHTGLVDFPNTPAGRAKVLALRKSHEIPDFNHDLYVSHNQPSYFTEEEDDITNGVDMNATSTTVDMGVDTSDAGADAEMQPGGDSVEMGTDGPVDVSGGAATDAVPTDTDTSAVENTPELNDIASQIQESALYLDLIDQFHGTTHLGYDLLQAQGFNYVKPVESFFIKRAPAKTK